MTIILKQFIIKKLRDPLEKQVEADIEWVCNSLGFLSSRDEEKTAFNILKNLIYAAREGKGLTSKELTVLVKPTIGSVIFHLKKLMKAGIVIKENSIYQLRMNSLLRTIEEIEKDLKIALDNIKKIAGQIDSEIGLEHR